MVEHNQRFVAVMEGKNIVGAITRTDILRSLYEDVLRKSRITTEQTFPARASMDSAEMWRRS